MFFCFLIDCRNVLSFFLLPFCFIILFRFHNKNASYILLLVFLSSYVFQLVKLWVICSCTFPILQSGSCPHHMNKIILSKSCITYILTDNKTRCLFFNRTLPIACATNHAFTSILLAVLIKSFSHFSPASPTFFRIPSSLGLPSSLKCHCFSRLCPRSPTLIKHDS